VERAQGETERVRSDADERHVSWRHDTEVKLAALREEVASYRSRMAEKEADTRKAVDAARAEMERYLVRRQGKGQGRVRVGLGSYRSRMAEKEADTPKAVDAARAAMERYLVCCPSPPSSPEMRLPSVCLTSPDGEV
jgi:ribosomal protein L16/L10AE